MADNVKEQNEELTEGTKVEETTTEVPSTEPSNEEVEQIIESENTSLVQDGTPVVEDSVPEVNSKQESEEPVEEPKIDNTEKVELAGIDITPVEPYHPVRIRRVSCDNRHIWCEGVDSSFLYTVTTKGGRKDDVIKLNFLVNQPIKNIKLDGKSLSGEGNSFDLEFKVIGYHFSMAHQVMTSYKGHDDVVKLVIINEPSVISDAEIVS